VTRFGEVLVTDTGNKRVQVFDERGTFKRAVGTEGTAPGQFREPVGIAVDREGRVYVADTWNQRIQVFDTGLQPVAQYPVQGWSSQSLNNKPYIAVGSEGEVYATVPENRTIVRLKDGQVEQLTIPAAPRLRVPIGITTDPRGRIYIGDSQDGVVQALELELRSGSGPGGSGEPASEPQ
jgi:sugar lactone lactonase YvrE